MERYRYRASPIREQSSPRSHRELQGRSSRKQSHHSTRETIHQHEDRFLRGLALHLGEILVKELEALAILPWMDRRKARKSASFARGQVNQPRSTKLSPHPEALQA